MLQLPQGQLHGLCLMARLIFRCCPPCKGDTAETGTMPVTALWVMPQVLLWRWEKASEIMAVFDSPLLTEAAAIQPSHRLYFFVFQTLPQFGYASPGRSLGSTDLPWPWKASRRNKCIGGTVEGGRAQISCWFFAVILKSWHKAEEVADLAVHLPP